MTQASSSPTTRRSVVRVVGAALGVALLVWAIVTVTRSAPTLEHVRAALNAPSFTVIAVALAAGLASFPCSAGVFHALLRRHGSLRYAQMVKAITASGLLNYAPLRPGLFGRIAYQHVVGGVSMRRGLWSTVEVGVIAMLATLWLALAVLVVSRCDARALGAIMTGAPLLAGLALLSDRERWWKPYAEALVWRWLDSLSWTARYWAVFALVGVELSWESAAAAACVGLSASLIPIVGGGLGIREWAVALAGPLLGAWPEDLGLAADLLNRAIDLALIVPLGLAATISAAREMKGAAAVRRVAR